MPKYVVGIVTIDAPCIDETGLKFVVAEDRERACWVALPDECEALSDNENLIVALENYANDGDCVLVLIEMDNLGEKEVE